MKNQRKILQTIFKNANRNQIKSEQAEIKHKDESVMNQYQIPQFESQTTVKNKPTRKNYYQLEQEQRSYVMLAPSSQYQAANSGIKKLRPKTSSKQRKPILRHRKQVIPSEQETQPALTHEQQIRRLKTVVDFLTNKLQAEQQSARMFRHMNGEKWLMHELNRVHQMLTEQRWTVRQLKKQLDEQRETNALLKELVDMQGKQQQGEVKEQTQEMQTLKINTFNILKMKEDMESLKKDLQCLREIVSQQRAYISELQIEVKLLGGAPNGQPKSQRIKKSQNSPHLVKKDIIKPSQKLRQHHLLSTINERSSEISSNIDSCYRPVQPQIVN